MFFILPLYLAYAVRCYQYLIQDAGWPDKHIRKKPGLIVTTLIHIGEVVSETLSD